jgi:glycosyltransferase involved in cell wall biosynthesis
VNIHWHWPFARPEELAWAHATVHDGDTLTISVVDRDAAPAARTDGAVRVVRDLVDVRRDLSVGPRWFWSRGITYVRRWSTRRRYWCDANIDLTHIHYINRFTDSFVGRRRPRGFVISVHDLEPHVRRLPMWLERALLRRIYRRADGLVVHHDVLRQALIDDYGLPAERVHVVEHQVFPVDESLRTTEPTATRPTILFFGAMRPNKGVDLFVDAIRLLPSDLEVDVVLAGRGDPAVEDQARAAAAMPHVTAEIGHATYERKAELFRSATVVVLPYTEFSSQSGVLHDAYGHGRPVVVTEVGALGDTVRREATGSVVPPGDARALADAIERYVTDSAHWSAAAEAARGMADKRSPAVVGAQLRAVYDGILS